jgi:hypothetical protein
MSMDMDHGSEGVVDHGEGDVSPLSGPDAVGDGGWEGLLGDHKVRALLKKNHHPFELTQHTVRFIEGDRILDPTWPGKIACQMCKEPWPCRVQRTIAQREETEARQRGEAAMLEFMRQGKVSQSSRPLLGPSGAVSSTPWPAEGSHLPHAG